MNLKQLLFGKQLAQIQMAQYQNSTQKWLPIADIQEGVVITKDGRYIKVLEVLPVNFELKSPIERQNIIYYYASYLKIAPDNLQIKVLTQKADIEGYVIRGPPVLTITAKPKEGSDVSCRRMLKTER